MRADSLENLTHYFEREGFAFYLSPACPLDVERLCDLVRLRARPALWLKETRRRKIMADGGCLVKLYTCNGLRDLTHSRRYASREVECYHDFLKAFGELPGVRLPQLYGYFARPFLGVLFRANGLVEEFVEGTRQTTVAELPLLPPLFAHLYRRAIYHPDMQFQNILWEEAEQRLVPIDYMGCNILEKPSWEALLMQLAWFAVAGKLSDAQSRRLFEETCDLLPELELDRSKAFQCIQALRGHAFETHQYRHPLFLPPAVRKKCFDSAGK